VFTIEIKVGTYHKTATAYCKKQAKQEAAKLMFEDLNKYILEKEKQNVDGLDIYKDIQKLGVEVHECQPMEFIAEKSKEAETFFIKYKMSKEVPQDYLIKDSHTLFERKYSSKFSDNMKERMKMICAKRVDQLELVEKMIEEIENKLEVKVQQINFSKHTKNNIICLRLPCHPNITQFGIGKTEEKAKLQAMYNIMLTILTLLS